MFCLLANVFVLWLQFHLGDIVLSIIANKNNLLIVLVIEVFYKRYVNCKIDLLGIKRCNLDIVH